MKKTTQKLGAEQVKDLTSYKREKGRSATEAMRVLAILLSDSGADSSLIKNLRSSFVKKVVL